MHVCDVRRRDISKCMSEHERAHNNISCHAAKKDVCARARICVRTSYMCLRHVHGEDKTGTPLIHMDYSVMHALHESDEIAVGSDLLIYYFISISIRFFTVKLLFFIHSFAYKGTFVLIHT